LHLLGLYIQLNSFLDLTSPTEKSEIGLEGLFPDLRFRFEETSDLAKNGKQIRKSSTSAGKVKNRPK